MAQKQYSPGAQAIASSIRNRDTAASNALFRLLTLLIVGSNTPAVTLSLIWPLRRSKPYRMYFFFPSSLGADWAAPCAARSVPTSSVLSFAAFTASVLGITRSASANSAMASCSRDAYLFVCLFVEHV